MNRYSFLLAMTFTLTANGAVAQVPDHLQCFRIKDALAKAQYTATFTPDDGTFPVAAGCVIKTPAKLLCVDAVKSAVTPVPPGADDGPDAVKYLCYKAKCPKSEPVASLTDQFGTHAIVGKGTSLVCAPVPEAAAPSCVDGLQNGTESDVDCGGDCPGCQIGDSCNSDPDCASSYCSGGQCATPPSSCSDAIQNGVETGVDCGGGICPACAPGQGCNAGSDCTSQVCMGGLCQSPACNDGVQNGSETDIDCGGSCMGCTNGGSCNTGGDCVSGTCQSGTCVSLLGNGSPCTMDPQCASSQCVDGVCCNSACSGSCQACTFASTGTTSGTCALITAGTDPDNECAGTSVCDGMGMCSP